MAAVGFEPMTLGFLSMAPTHCTIDADPGHMTFNLQPTPTCKKYSGHCESVIDYFPLSRALMDADITQPVSSWSCAVIWQMKTWSNHRFFAMPWHTRNAFGPIRSHLQVCRGWYWWGGITPKWSVEMIFIGHCPQQKIRTVLRPMSADINFYYSCM